MTLNRHQEGKPVNTPLGSKLYYSISEVSELTGMQPYTLRAWEKEFPWLRPKRARGKNRAYRDRDIGVVLLIKSLLYEHRYTSQGVKQRLRDHPELLREAGSQPALMFDARSRRRLLGGNARKPLPEVSSRTSASDSSREIGRDGVGMIREIAPASSQSVDLLGMVRDELRALLEML